MQYDICYGGYFILDTKKERFPAPCFVWLFQNKRIRVVILFHYVQYNINKSACILQKIL